MKLPGNLQAAMRQAQQMQQKMQEEVAQIRVEASAGGGMVSAMVSGALRVLEVRIEPSLLAAGDREMLQDLIAAAVNAALHHAQTSVQQELQRAGAALGLPDLSGAEPPR